MKNVSFFSMWRLALIIVFITFYISARPQMFIYGLTDEQQLVKFDADDPDSLYSSIIVRGIIPGQKIVGMDFRPSTGELYVLGYSDLLNQGQLYVIDTVNGAATLRGFPINNLDLTGEVGFDFNPTVDLIRVVSWGNQNYRINPMTGQLTQDQPLHYANTDANSGRSPAIGSIAYTNSYIGSVSNSLIVFDDSLNSIALLTPPNNGTLTTIGSVGITLNPNEATSDIDIFFDKHAFINRAYLVANTGNTSFDKLYNLNLTTGEAVMEDTIGVGVDLVDIAVFIDRTPPGPNGPMIYAHTSNNNLISFYPGTPDYLFDAVPIKGLAAGQEIVGLDFRPANGRLYALGYNNAQQVAQLYWLDTLTATATPVGGLITSIDLSGKVAVDFNPVVDRLRVMTSNDKNYRINPNDGSLVARDVNLVYATGDTSTGINPSIGAATYNNSYFGATTTTLFVMDDSLNNFGMLANPNDGIITTIGNTFLVDSTVSQTTGMDAFFNHGDNNNVVYLHTNRSSTLDILYAINDDNGGATEIGFIGYGVPVLSMAISLDQRSIGVGTGETMVNPFALFVFPNPATDLVNAEFELLRNDAVSLRILDIMGREVRRVLTNEALHPGVHRVAIDVSYLGPGMYLLVMENSQSSVTIRLMK